MPQKFIMLQCNVQASGAFRRLLPAPSPSPLPFPVPFCLLYVLRYCCSRLNLGRTRNKLSLRSHTLMLMHTLKRSVIATQYQTTGRQPSEPWRQRGQCDAEIRGWSGKYWGTARPNICRGSRMSWYWLRAQGFAGSLGEVPLLGYGVYCAYDVT